MGATVRRFAAILKLNINWEDHPSNDHRNVPGSVMKTRLSRIGNSKGIRIPESLLEQTGLADEVELIFSGNSLVIRPASRSRQRWARTFEKMVRCGDDIALDDHASNEFDEAEWEW